MADTLLEYLGPQRANRILLAVIDGQHHLADTAYVSEPGDVPATYANVDDLIDDVGYKPATPVEEGIARFVDWYRDFYNV